MPRKFQRRSFFGAIAAVIGGALAWRPKSVFASDLRRTLKYHPDLKEYGIGFDCDPDLLLDRAKFHRACEAMRYSMVVALEKRGPINLWRVGQVNVTHDPRVGADVVTLRTRACRTDRLDWTMPPEGINVRGMFRARGGPDAMPHFVPLEPKAEGAAYTFFQPE